MLVETIHKWGEEIETIGVKKGEKIGKKLNAIETAQNLLALNTLTFEQIAKATALSLEEVMQLQAP